MRFFIAVLSFVQRILADLALAVRVGTKPVAGGAVYEVSVAAATAVLGYNMFQNQPFQTSGRPRRIVGLAVTGSAAGGDAAVDLKIGSITVASKYNTTTGFPTKDHVVPINAFIPPGELISCVVTDAPLTNPLNVLIEIVG